MKNAKRELLEQEDTLVLRAVENALRCESEPVTKERFARELRRMVERPIGDRPAIFYKTDPKE